MRLLKLRKLNIEAVFLKYSDMLYRVALARLGNDAEAQDAVQDVFVKYMTSAPDCKDEAHEKAWLLRTIVNLCHDINRHQSTLAFVPLDQAHKLSAEDRQAASNVLMLVAQLPPLYKDVVILHSLEGFKLEETAQILGISLSAAKMRLSRAREILQVLRKEEYDV